MAKHNKNRKQQGAQKQSRSSADATQERMEHSSTDEPRSKAQGSPADVARKHQRRFGHN